MIHDEVVKDHVQNFRDISIGMSDLRHRVAVLEANQEHLEGRVTSRDEEVKAIAGVVFEIKQMRIDFNKVGDIVKAHGDRLDELQNKPGVLALAALSFIFGATFVALLNFIVSKL
jgi:uncharacterized protein YpuA (DUF1002 family)